MLDHRRRRWANVAQMLYKVLCYTPCFVFAGLLHVKYIAIRL